jgi:hypothetical protein
MSGATLLLPQYAFMAWCSDKAQGQLYLFYFLHFLIGDVKTKDSELNWGKQVTDWGETCFSLLHFIFCLVRETGKLYKQDSLCTR